MDFKLDLAALSAPISAERPTGDDLRSDDSATSLYRQAKDARTAARAIERLQIQGGDLSVKPNWSTVYTLAVQALCKETKDLEIAVWLSEALLREQGFAGLRDGFVLIKELIQLYWDDLFPMPDEDGLITRLAPLAGLNGEATEGTLIAAIALVPLTQGRSVGPFSLWQYQQALEIIKISDAEKRNQRLLSGGIALEMIAQAIEETSTEFLQQQIEELTACIEAFTALTQLLDQKAGEDAPPSSRILAQLNACVDCINVIARDNFKFNSSISSATDEVDATNNITKDIFLSENSSIESSSDNFKLQDLQQKRQEIINSLLSAANFFQRTEPHSPVPYLLERAVKWSKLPLPLLLKELISDEQALGHYCNLTGVITDAKK